MISIPEALRKASVLIFDFDGTLVDSNPIKIKAFDSCFADYPEKLPEIQSYVKENHHLLRFVKFRHIYEKILKLSYSNAIEEKLNLIFERETTDAVTNADQIPGALSFLQKWGPHKAFILLSSTPQTTIEKILIAKNWTHFFDLIKGAPVNKTFFLEDFKKTRNLESQDIVFFGDSTEDANAAKKAQVGFVGVANSQLDEPAGYFISDYAPLLESR